MRLRVLGCSGGISLGRGSTSYMIDDDILIDAGTGLGYLTLDEMSRIRHIFLTHCHLDHIAALPLMIDSIFERIEQPIIIHALPETLDALRTHIFNWMIWPEFANLPTATQPVMAYQPMTPGEITTLGERSFEMIPVKHAVPAVGYRITSPTGVMAFSGDMSTNDTFWDALNAHDRLDLLIVETSFTNAALELSRKAYHYCPSLLAQDIAKLRHRPRLLITHVKPGQEERICNEIRAAIPEFEVQCLSGGEIFTI